MSDQYADSAQARQIDRSIEARFNRVDSLDWQPMRAVVRDPEREKAERKAAAGRVAAAMVKMERFFEDR